MTAHRRTPRRSVTAPALHALAALLLAVMVVPEFASAAIAGTGYSASLSSNPSLRRQQLLCDPDDPFSGSTSTEYDPDVVFLNAVDPVSGYRISDLSGGIQRIYVEIRDPNNEVNELITFDQLPAERKNGATETGYVQVFFVTDLSSSGGVAGGAPPDYFFEDSDGTDGTITHRLEFQYLSNVTDDTKATYRNYADDGVRGIEPDFLTKRDPDTGQVTNVPFTGTPDQIDAIVSGDLIVPEPSSLALLGSAVAALAVTRRRRAAVAA